MNKFKTLNFYHGPLKFAVGHFTIFSPTVRERIHGHNYTLEASVTAALGAPGITFDYNIFGDRLIALCNSLDLHFLLAGNSPYLTITEDKEHCHVVFDHKKMSFLKDDVIILPLENITLEDLSQWFISQITADHAFIEKYKISEIVIKVFNGTEQSATSLWASNQ